MNIRFSKYQGTGNDFILIDDRDQKFPASNHQFVAKLCDRRFGIGADGLMLLRSKTGYDFEMIYYNSDGNTSSMCGNGGRCIVEFARSLGLVKNKATFLASDGEHEAEVKQGYIALKMNNVSKVEMNADFCYLNTGSPHYVAFVHHVEQYPVFTEGRKIRNSDRFKEKGTNVNFVEKKLNELFVRTYERGVEDETYSCGTGVTAAALVAALKEVSTTPESCEIITLGGKLKVRFKRNPDNSFSDIWLDGPATFVYSGEVNG